MARLARLRDAPATCLYVFALLVTSATLAAADHSVRSELLRELSTNLTNLEHFPVRVLVLSAFWIDNVRVLPELALFFVVSVPVERWLGTARWLVVFVLGHVGATLLTAVGVYVWTDDGRHHRRLVHGIDVGISYGMFAIAAVLFYRLPTRWRLPYGLTLLLALLVAMYYDATFTDIGHLCAIAIGFACYPLTRLPARPIEPTAAPLPA